MKLCLVFPRTTVFDEPMGFPPLGLFWLKAVLKENGHEVHFIDMSEYKIGQDGKKVELYPDVNSLPLGYDAYLVSGTSPQAGEIRKIGEYLKNKGCLAIAGGPHISNYAGVETSEREHPNLDLVSPTDPKLVANFHILVKFEGEQAILGVLERLEEGKRFMDAFGRGIVISSPRIQDLGSIPIPNREDALKYHYYLNDEDGKARRGTSMFTSRGCPERCAFCDSPGLWGRKVRYTPIHRVIQELEQIKSLGFEAIQFYDDILPLNRPRMIEICRNLKKFGFVWRCFMRVDIMSHHLYGEGFIRMMKENGLAEVLVGVESGDQRILDGIHKGTTIEQNTQVLKWCKNIGVRFKASVILGLPGETKESMQATRDWVIKNRPDKCAVAVFIPYSGTPIAKSTELGRKKGYGIDAVHDYDFKPLLESALMDEYFCAGSRKLKPLGSTSSLSVGQIEDFYNQFVAELDDLGITN